MQEPITTPSHCLGPVQSEADNVPSSLLKVDCLHSQREAGPAKSLSSDSERPKGTCRGPVRGHYHLLLGILEVLAEPVQLLRFISLENPPPGL